MLGRPHIESLREFDPAHHFVNLMGRSLDEVGAYWIICIKQLGERRRIPREYLRHYIRTGKLKRERIVSALLKCGLIKDFEGLIFVDWCEEEIERTFARPPQGYWRQLREAVFERDEYTCSYCGSKGGDLEADHIIPASRGGHATLENLTTACRDCNRSKRHRTPDEWR